MNRLASLVANVELALQDDLHLMVGICIDKRRALFQSVDAAAERLLWVDLVVADNVTKESILVGDQRRLEFRLDFGEVAESLLGAHFRCAVV